MTDDQTAAKARLLTTVNEHDCIYLIERRRSRSNETAIVDFVVARRGQITSVGADVAALCDLNYDRGLRGATIRRPVQAEDIITRAAAVLFPRGALKTAWL
jgi:hypothetical protein